jgi:hypothetical protein
MPKRNYPDFIEAYLKYTSNHESTKRIQLWTILSVMAGAIERKLWIDRGYYTLYPNLYVMIIAKSGLVKKSTSTAIGVNLLREIDNIRFMSERLTAASLIKQMADSYKLFQVQGDIQETQQSPLYAYGSELAVMMGEVYGSIIELLTTFYDCQPNDPTKPWSNKAKHEDKISIYGPCLNILGASTKSWLYKAIPNKEMEGGFASRCVFVVENGGPSKLVAWPEITPELDEMKTKLISDLYMINEMAGAMTVTPGARKRFEEFYEYHMTEILPNNHDPRFMGYLSRKPDLMLKLALIRSVSLGDSKVIGVEHLEWAGARIEAIEPEMMEAFHKKPASTGGGLTVNDVMAYMEGKDYVDLRDLNDHFGTEGHLISRMFTRMIANKKIQPKYNQETGEESYRLVTQSKSPL